VLLINIHELDIIFADSVRVGRFEDQVDDVGGVLSLHREHIVILCSAEHLRERAEVDAEGDVSVATERVEGLGSEEHGDQGNVGVVHSLQRNAGVIAVEVAVLHQIFDGIDYLHTVSLCLHSGLGGLSTFLSTTAWFRRASSTAKLSAATRPSVGMHLTLGLS